LLPLALACGGAKARVAEVRQRLAAMPSAPAFFVIRLKRMNILKKTFAIRTCFDYISAPRQAELLEEKR